MHLWCSDEVVAQLRFGRLWISSMYYVRFGWLCAVLISAVDNDNVDNVDFTVSQTERDIYYRIPFFFPVPAQSNYVRRPSATSCRIEFGPSRFFLHSDVWRINFWPLVFPDPAGICNATVLYFARQKLANRTRIILRCVWNAHISEFTAEFIKQLDMI